MALSNGANLGLLVNGALGETHLTELMKQWRGLDALVQASVKDKDLATPPGSPADGDRYIVAASPTGAWVGHAGKIARYSTVAVAWEMFTGKEGWVVWVDDEDAEYRHDGTSFKFAKGAGTGAARPASGLVGASYFNTTTSKPNWYTGSAWVDATGTAA